MALQTEALDAFRHRIARDEKRGMRTDVGVYASAAMLAQISQDLALEQAVNVATLPGIVVPSLAMPDIHQGYGFPIGGVAATDWNHGVVSPGGVGFDINCGVRGAATDGPLRVTGKQLDEVLVKGARWAVENGDGMEGDLKYCEAAGCLGEADPAAVSARAKERGRPQLATLGSGNHFLDIQYVEKIHDSKAARVMGLEEGQVVVLIHCGSRGPGHQVCTGYLGQMGPPAMKRYGIWIPDRQLACVPIQSPEGQAYLGAMRAAANFAWANRQAMLHYVRGACASSELWPGCWSIRTRPSPVRRRKPDRPGA